MKPARKSFPDEISNFKAGQVPISGLLADITHEVRTPMNGMFGMLDFLLASELSGDQREAAMTAQAAAEDLLAFFNNIIDLPMAEADALPLRQTSFDLDSALKAILDSISTRARIKDADIEIRYLGSDRPLAVIGDIDRLRQIFSNLVTYVTRQQPQERILMEAACTPVEGGRCMLQVCMHADSAMLAQKLFPDGADERGLPHRFNAGELGLVICRHLIERMGGKMEIARHRENEVRILTSLEFDPAPAALTGVRVLLIDGDPERRASMADLLASRHIRVDSAGESSEALDALADAHNADDAYRMVILARHLRGIDGEALGKAIKADPAYRDIDILLLGSGDPAKLEKAGFAAMVSDAADTQLLLSAMEKLCLSTSAGSTGLFLIDGHAQPESAAAFGFAGKRILVVDDDAVNRRVALRMLEELGCSISTACDGKQALSMHTANAYDLILMDCEMPVMDGFETTARIRATEGSGSRTPIIAWTARLMAGGAGNLLAGGFDDLMPKPMRRQALQEMLSAWLPAQAIFDETVESNDEDEIAEVRKIFGHGFAELAELFQSDSSKRIGALQSAASSNDTAQIAKIAHAFSGSAASIGAIGLSTLCKELEMQSRTGALHDVGERLNAIEKEFAHVMEKLQAMLATDIS